jgi:hypothetical protein
LVKFLKALAANGDPLSRIESKFRAKPFALGDIRNATSPCVNFRQMPRARQGTATAILALLINEPAGFEQRTITEPVANWFDDGLALFR